MRPVDVARGERSLGLLYEFTNLACCLLLRVAEGTVDAIQLALDSSN